MPEEETKEDEPKTAEEIEYEQELENVAKRSRESSLFFTKFSLSFILCVFLIIGLPIWWKTTTPERWDLPNVSILSEKVQSIKHLQKISVVFFEGEQTSETRSFFGRQVAEQRREEKQTQNVTVLKFVTEYSVRQAFQQENDLFKIWQSHQRVDDLEKIFSSSNVYRNNHLMFYILPAGVKTDKLLHSGQSKIFFIDTNHLSIKSQPSELFTIIDEQVKRNQLLSEAFYLNLNKNDQSNLLLMGREFEFVFDILFEDENRLFDGKSHEECMKIRDEMNARIKATMEKMTNYFYSKCQSINFFFKMNFVSQIFHFALPDNFILNNLAKMSSRNALELSKIDRILDYVESKRIDHGNENSYHIVLIMTQKTMLSFMDSDDQSILLTTPFRGSILIDNDDHTLYEGFHRFLQEFFHLEEFHQYSVDAAIRSIAQKQIIKTLQSLEATEKLLKTVSNIVIQKNISDRMHQSFNDALIAAQMLEDGTDISAIFDKSHSAYILSEKAFYDPSLLSLLYFPEDQKYAIYLPLFLPVCLPVFMNIANILKRTFKSIRATKAKIE